MKSMLMNNELVELDRKAQTDFDDKIKQRQIVDPDQYMQ